MASRVYYHGADLDGWACAAIYATKRRKVHLYPIDYGQKFDTTDIEKNDVVAILDFCPDDPHVIQLIIEQVPVFYWFDHHESSRKMYEREKFKDIHTPPGLFVTDSKENPMSACELLYMYMYDCEYKDISYYIRLLGRYDVWQHDSDPQVLPFQYAMRAWLGDPRTNLQQWKKLLNPSSSDHKLFQKLIEHGKFIQMHEEKESAKKAETLCFEMEFEGYKTLAINRTLESSKFFESIYDPKKHDLILQFAYHGDFWKLSFRSAKPEVNCAEIAERFGCGGHAMSAGATVQELPKEIKERINVDA